MWKRRSCTWRCTLVTTEAVLTEATHALAAVHGGEQRYIDLFTREIIVVIPLKVRSLARSAVLMHKYRDVLTDYADATLVTLCEELDEACVFTLDRRGFGVYRMHGCNALELLPQQKPAKHTCLQSLPKCGASAARPGFRRFNVCFQHLAR